MKIKLTQPINNLVWQTSFFILIVHEQWVVTEFVLFSQKSKSIPPGVCCLFDSIVKSIFVFVDHNGVSFEKHQAASYLLHLSGYLHWT